MTLRVFQLLEKQRKLGISPHLHTKLVVEHLSESFILLFRAAPSLETLS